MAKNLTKQQWLKVFKLVDKKQIKKSVELYNKFNPRKYKARDWKVQIRIRILNKHFLWENESMKIFKKRNGRPKKNDNSDIPGLIDRMNEEQKREIIEDWIKEQRKKKDKKKKAESLRKFNVSFLAKIFDLHRSTFYKKPIPRKYKFEWIRNDVEKIFNKNKGIYGSNKIAKVLEKGKMSLFALEPYVITWKDEELWLKLERQEKNLNQRIWQ